ncbi:MAG: universal stress protein [Prochloraceae cyanobacterium]
MFKIILFPLDRTRESREAAEVAIDLVKTYDSSLILLSVVENNTDDDLMGSQEAVAKLLQEARGFFADRGIKAEVIEREGIPSFTICDVADEIGANLIVMGCRGLGLTSEGVSDSVTNKVINLSPCPVLVVP